MIILFYYFVQKSQFIKYLVMNIVNWKYNTSLLDVLRALNTSKSTPSLIYLLVGTL